VSTTVPADTTTYVDAVAEGFYGDRTDPNPDYVYDVTETPPTPPRSMGGFTPQHVSLAAASGGVGFDLTVTGEFPDDASVLQVKIAQPTMGGTTLDTAGLMKDSPTQLTAQYADTAGMVEGTAQVYVWVVPEATAYPGSGTVTFDP
jgi:hypothetical protein